MLRHRFVKEPKSELMSRKGNILPLISILEALISRIYALLHILFVVPRVPVLVVNGFKLVLTSIHVVVIYRIYALFHILVERPKFEPIAGTIVGTE